MGLTSNVFREVIFVLWRPQPRRRCVPILGDPDLDAVLVGRPVEWRFAPNEPTSAIGVSKPGVRVKRWLDACRGRVDKDEGVVGSARRPPLPQLVRVRLGAGGGLERRRTAVTEPVALTPLCQRDSVSVATGGRTVWL